jgi:hypothetical protein
MGEIIIIGDVPYPVFNIAVEQVRTVPLWYFILLIKYGL